MRPVSRRSGSGPEDFENGWFAKPTEVGGSATAGRPQSPNGKSPANANGQANGRSNGQVNGRVNGHADDRINDRLNGGSRNGVPPVGRDDSRAKPPSRNGMPSVARDDQRAEPPSRNGMPPVARNDPRAKPPSRTNLPPATSDLPKRANPASRTNLPPAKPVGRGDLPPARGANPAGRGDRPNGLPPAVGRGNPLPAGGDLPTRANAVRALPGPNGVPPRGNPVSRNNLPPGDPPTRVNPPGDLPTRVNKVPPGRHDTPTVALPAGRNDPPTVANVALPAVGPFDRERFDDGLTDPGPFGRVAFETHPPVRSTPKASADRPIDILPPDEPPDDKDEGEPIPKPKAKRKLPLWIELPVLVVVALLLTFTIQTFVARVYVIPSGSMEQTLNGNNGTGDRILVDKVVYDFHAPRPGDVVVFKGPTGWDQTEFFVDNSNNPVTHWLHQLASSIGIAKPDEYDLVKRVIAVGGQTISCCDSQNRIIVNGKPLTEPYVYWQPDRGGPAQQLRFGPVTVPQGDLWVMGDNRNNSDDSRFQNGGGIHGVVPVGNVIGKARTIIWPPSRWRGIGDYNAQTAAGVAAGAPGWFGSVPATGIGVLAALPTLWFGRRFGKRLRAAAMCRD